MEGWKGGGKNEGFGGGGKGGFPPAGGEGASAERSGLEALGFRVYGLGIGAFRV